MKNTKKVLSMMLVLVLCITLCLPIAYANNDNIKVMLNGEYVEFDVQPQLINGRTMVPFRAIFEAMGAEVSWNQELWQASGEKDGKNVQMTIDRNQVTVTNNGVEKVIEIDQAPILIDNRTMVPVRFVAQAFDKIVAWDNETKTVIIFDLDFFVDRLAEKAPNFYECVTAVKNIPETFKAKDNIELEVLVDTPYNNAVLNVDGEINSIVNKTDAYMGMKTDIIVKNNDERQSINAVADIFFKDNYIVIKTNVFEILGSDSVEYNGKFYSIKKDGMFFDLAQLGISGINTFEDFVNLYTEGDTIDKTSNQINDAIYNQAITVKDAKDIIAIYDLFLDLVSNDKFTKSTTSNTTVYTWKIDKEDIQECVLNLFKSGIIPITGADLEDVKKMNDLFKDFKIVSKLHIKDNMPVKSTCDMDITIGDEEFEISMDINLTEDITNINKGPFTINHPNIESAFDIMAYMKQFEEQSTDEYDLAVVQDSVTLYISKCMMGNETEEVTPTVEEALAQIYIIETDAWTADARTLLNIEGIDLTQYQVDATGVVTKGQSSVMVE